jgi:hypothetical protein
MPIFTDNDAILVAKPSGALTDSSGNQWTIENGRILVNGSTDWSTARVVALVYSNGQVWQENADGNWWGKTGPADQWQPTYGTKTAPTPDGNSSSNIVTMSSFDTPIVDDNRNVWSIVDSQVAVDGVIDQSTRNVTELAYVNGQVWQQNTDGLWWAKSTPTDSWNPPYGTINSPVQNIDRVWEGMNANFSWGDHWNATGVPQAGDTATINSGTVSVDPGYGLGVNFALGGSTAEASFSAAGGYLIGNVAGTGTITAGNYSGPQSVATVSLDSVTVNTGESLTLNQIQFSGNFIIRGNSVVHQGDLKVAETGVNHTPYGSVENDGIMVIDGGSVESGHLSGNGSMRLINNGYLQTDTGGHGLVILESGRMEVGFGYDPVGTKTFDGIISQFGADSSVQVDSVTAFLAVVKHYSPDVKEMFLISPDNKVVGDFHFSGGASTLYASTDPNTPGGGGVIISAHDNGHSLPIIDV